MEENTLNTELNEEDRPGESKADKFLRLAPPRINKVLHDMDTLGKLSGSGYEYSEEQIAKMFAAIDAKVDELKSKFGPKEKAAKETFSF